ncbi:MAG: glycosyltransferase [Patescibacteria group bacterium]|nr:glycosyltransferase [Patescibacteria group bacterium]
MKILYFATYYLDNYVRQNVIINCLKEIKSIDVIECVVNKKSLFRYLQVFWKYLFISKKDIDVIIVGFRGHEVLPFLRLLTKKPIIFDAFISLYDTLCFERKVISPYSLIGKLMFYFEKYLLGIVDHILLDTKTHVKFFKELYKIPKNKISSVYVGADKNIFYPRQEIKKINKFIVLYYSTFRPLHGLEYIVESAKLLENKKNIIFKIIGRGPKKNKINKIVAEKNINNIEFIDWIKYEKLPEEIAKADVCLGGHFSKISKAKRVIPGKVYQFLAMKKPVIVSQNEANKEVFISQNNCLMVKNSDPKDLVKAITQLENNKILIEKISEKGFNTFLSVQERIKNSLEEIIKKNVRK